MPAEEGQGRVLGWQSLALVAGTCLAFLGVAVVLYSDERGAARSTGWWMSGLAAGVLTTTFSFPIAALDEPKTVMTTLLS